jgi:hypothetical protein
MDQPEGFCQSGEIGAPLACLLKKSIHGLKQAPHNWHRLLNRFLLTQHCVQLRSDHGAYVYRSVAHLCSQKGCRSFAFS